ncbi:MAG: hypothetical protein AB8B74_04295 [Crocinitomicaceae bacterium]
MITFLSILGIILLIILIIYLTNFVPLRKNEEGFEYVNVEENGTVRELSREEQGYLKETFEPGDGGRPYIKTRYNSKTPDGKIWGFIPRNRVPKRIKIIKPEMDKETWRRNWILMIKDLTNLEYQKRTWLDPKNSNPYYSFIEFMCSYFDDLNISDGYENLINNGLVSKTEYDSIYEWNKLLSEYESPKNDDYDNNAILNDPKWTRIIEIGVIAIENLKPKLSKLERGLMI